MDNLTPDSEGGWICDKHKKERGTQKHGSNCYRCLLAKNKRLRETIERALRIKDLWLFQSEEEQYQHESEALATMLNMFEEALED